MVKRTGKAASRTADVGDNVIVSAKIAADTIQLADMLEYHTSTSAVSDSVTISHNLGTTPTEIVITQLSSEFLGHLSKVSANASQAVIGTSVSGSYKDVVFRV